MNKSIDKANEKEQENIYYSKNLVRLDLSTVFIKNIFSAVGFGQERIPFLSTQQRA